MTDLAASIPEPESTPEDRIELDTDEGLLVDGVPLRDWIKRPEQEDN